MSQPAPPDSATPPPAAAASSDVGTGIVPIRRVLVSVYDKTGLDRLAAALKAAGIVAVSTGGTARALEGFGVTVEDVSGVTGFPEVLDGRVKSWSNFVLLYLFLQMLLCSSLWRVCIHKKDIGICSRPLLRFLRRIPMLSFYG